MYCLNPEACQRLVQMQQNHKAQVNSIKLYNLCFEKGINYHRLRDVQCEKPNLSYFILLLRYISVENIVLIFSYIIYSTAITKYITLKLSRSYIDFRYETGHQLNEYDVILSLIKSPTNPHSHRCFHLCVLSGSRAINLYEVINMGGCGSGVPQTAPDALPPPSVYVWITASRFRQRSISAKCSECK